MARLWLSTKSRSLCTRLCTYKPFMPDDYHRFHFPIDGKLSQASLINGHLFSVSPIALRQRISIFWENKRYLHLSHPQVGTVMNSNWCHLCWFIHLTRNGPTEVRKGAEYGYFSFGGSCVMTLFPKNSVVFRDDLVKQSSQGFETYSKFGDYLGKYID